VTLRFADYTLDTDTRELRLGADMVAVEPQVFDLLVYLIANRDRVVSKDDLLDAVWGGRIVSESTLTTRINAARRAVGDSGERQQLIRTIARKGFRFVAPVADDAETAREPPGSPGQRPQLHQEVQFCTASDGTRIAYATVGDGPPLIKTGNWLNHLEYDWESPVWKHIYAELASRHRFIRYDARGNGLSDWDIKDFSFEAFVGDLECVVEASGAKRFPLLGISQGCAISVAYAVRHPERVSHLILYGGFARGWCKQGSADTVQLMAATELLMRQGWGRKNPAFRQYFSAVFMPDASPELLRSFNELQRRSTSPDNAVAILRSINEFDIDHLLPQVKVPTLVLHCRGDSAQPFDEGRRLAAGIPHARFVALDGRSHLILENDPTWIRFRDEVRAFLQTPDRRSSTAKD
jgi:DNA-binding winged helix-turn-helix (wHTH) protein/alpha-beta hydrolase superfamily lysophospholipase